MIQAQKVKTKKIVNFDPIDLIEENLNGESDGVAGEGGSPGHGGVSHVSARVEGVAGAIARRRVRDPHTGNGGMISCL